MSETWLSVGPLETMPELQIIPYSAAGAEFIIIRRGMNASAFIDRCSHQDIKLSEFGEIQRGVLLCHAHGAAFDCSNGRELCFPATAPLQTVPLRIRQGIVEIAP